MPLTGHTAGHTQLSGIQRHHRYEAETTEGNPERHFSAFRWKFGRRFSRSSGSSIQMSSTHTPACPR
eukprot:2273433-Pyramimonas_sp.AAC.1